MKFTDKMIDKYDALCRKHPRVDQVLSATALTCSLISIFCIVGSSINACIQGVRKNEQKRDDREAKLIAQKETATHSKQLNAGELYFDLDGTTNTAEAIVNYHTICPHTAEAVRQMKIGDIRKVSEWKKTLSHSCWERHYEWRELQ